MPPRMGSRIYCHVPGLDEALNDIVDDASVKCPVRTVFLKPRDVFIQHRHPNLSQHVTRKCNGLRREFFAAQKPVIGKHLRFSNP
jgi:hypothetical protein